MGRQGQEMLTLQSGDSSLVLAPEIGGAIVGWRLGAVPVMRLPAPDALMAGNVRGLACFPLVPFSNRIAWGRFRWDGVDYALDRNFGDHPHTIHGVGWKRPWQVADASPASATLALRHDAGGDQARAWPFPFVAEQQFTLTADALQLRLSMRNEHHAAAPAGLGWHPHFPLRGAPTLRFSAGQVWLNGADSLPSREEPVPPDWDHAAGRPVGSATLDNCFAGWDGLAMIDWGDGTGLRIEADETFRHVVIYTPPNRPYFCVEPVSHMTDAINRMDVPGHGLRVLAPGETLNGSVTFRLDAGSPSIRA
ncbi:MAG TPA: aldose 1-epimerase [Acetobacteraceae bacterium]|nr:aldose 1-epimerase [Acetobacteraceae bacterium]